MMSLKTIVLPDSVTSLAALGCVAGSIDTTVPSWVTLQQAQASPYCRSSRRTSRGTAYCHSHY